MLALVATVMALPEMSLGQGAGEYPVKPVRIIVPTAPGAATDLQARMMAQKLSESLKRPFVSTWHGWLAPAGTPAAITGKLSAELAVAVRSPDVARKLAEDGGVPVAGGPDQLQKLIALEVPRWRKVVQDSGMRME